LASRAMLSPIRKIIKKIDKISADDLSERIDDVDSSDELRELTDRINAMLDNLEQSFDRQKKFVSDASH
ncbi:MAG TPA: two-component sensor histidine kinase, partial [Clostridiales bacterium]|nr:two-component sensor histidine kinase [Clostridiales bacterium]